LKRCHNPPGFTPSIDYAFFISRLHEDGSRQYTTIPTAPTNLYRRSQGSGPGISSHVPLRPSRRGAVPVLRPGGDEAANVKIFTTAISVGTAPISSIFHIIGRYGYHLSSVSVVIKQPVHINQHSGFFCLQTEPIPREQEYFFTNYLCIKY
jgi:hypothetical protein